MKFRILDQFDQSLVGDVPETSVFIDLYAIPLEGEKRATELDVGETALVRMPLSGRGRARHGWGGRGRVRAGQYINVYRVLRFE